MQIKFLEPVKHDGRQYETGDIITVGDNIGTSYCTVGWCEDVSGATPTGTRDSSKVVQLDVHDSIVGVS